MTRSNSKKILTFSAVLAQLLAILALPTACTPRPSSRDKPAMIDGAAGDQVLNDGRVAFNLLRPGNVSAAIYDKDGRMVRELLRAEPMAAGFQTLFWDGLDRDGKPAEPGAYTWRLLRTDGLRSDYLMSVGTSIGSQWWPGNHEGPNCVAAAEDSVVVAAGTEGPPEIIRMTFDGKVLWERGSFEPARSPRDVQIAGAKVYYLQNNGKIHVLDFATGKSLGKPLPILVPVRTVSFPEIKSDAVEPYETIIDLPNGDYFLRFDHGDPAWDTCEVEVIANGIDPGIHRADAGKWSWYKVPSAEAGKGTSLFLPQLYGNPRTVEVRDGKLKLTFRPLPVSGKPVFWKVNQVEILTLPDRLAATEQELVVASSGGGVVNWLNPESGEILDRVAVPGVRDVSFGPEGTVFALTAKAVISFSRADKTPVVRVSGLNDPLALHWDSSTGDLLVLEGGKDRQQVKRYNLQGTCVATVGREGGRRVGAYVSGDIAGACGLAGDGHGGFFVAEPHAAPRRLVRFDRNGQVAGEWFGGMGFYVHTSLDPLNPNIGWMRPEERTSWLLKVEMDYQKKTWRPLATYRWDALLDPAFFPERFPEYTHFRCLRRDINGDGAPETLVFSQGVVSGLLFVVDEQAQILRPLAALGQVDADCFDDKAPRSVDELPTAWREAIRLAGGDPGDVKNRVKYANYSWADANGDGLMQGGELQLGPGPLKSAATCLGIDQNLVLWTGGYHTELYGMFQCYPPVRTTACGAPVWDLNGGKVGPKTTRKANTAALSVDPTGLPFVLLDSGGDGTMARHTWDFATHGWGWPATIRDGAALIRLDADGQRLWQSGPKAARWPHPRGQLMSPRNINGFVKGCVAVGDQTEQPCEFWTEDGLYVGGLFDGRDPWTGASRDGAPDPVYTWHGTRQKRIGANNYQECSLFAADDMLMGGSVAEMPDGSVVFLGHGGNNNPCYRITGFDGWDRMQGKIAPPKTASAAKGDGTGLLAEYFASADLSGEPLLKRVDSQVWYGHQKPWIPEVAGMKNFSGRWSGFLEPRFTEAYTLSVYASGDFKLLIDDKEVEWAKQDYPREVTVKKGHTVPIPLKAGERVSVVLEFRAGTLPRCDSVFLDLNWESLSQPVEHVPSSALYHE